jgi:alkanesulfonate monooxygenase SsuD/methylene tetrahydromethanopterin reductase-like flavin-dependent oxidoreductase (luciferase family)
MPDMSVGVALPHYDISWDVSGADGRGLDPGRLASAARTAERLGFSTGWVSDHFFLDPGRYGMPAGEAQAIEAWTAMTIAATATSTLRIGSLVLCEAFRPPGTLAKMAATLDVFSGGRLELGLGAGWFEAEYARHGFRFPPPGERVARLEDYARVVGGMLSGSPYTYAGRHYSCTEAWCVPGPVQQPRPPIWVGGTGDRMLGVVARVADGWNTVWWNPAVRTTDAQYRARAAVLARACEVIGRDPATVRRSLGLIALVGRDDADVARRYDRLAAELPAGSLPGLPAYRAGGLVGTPDQVAHRLGELADLGIEHVVVTPGPMPFRWSDEWAESIAEWVLPQLADSTRQNSLPSGS